MKNPILYSFFLLPFFASLLWDNWQPTTPTSSPTADILVCDRERDSLALVAINEANPFEVFPGQTEGMFEFPLGWWNLSDPLEEWQEGICLNAEGCVVSLDLDGFGNCEFGTSGDSDAWDNFVVIPDEIANLEELTFLSIGNGTFPENINNNLGQLQNLTTLEIKNTNLTTIPDWIEQLPNLNRLSLRNNQITEGFPDYFCRFCEIERTDFAGNSGISDAAFADFCAINCVEEDFSIFFAQTQPTCTGDNDGSIEAIVVIGDQPPIPVSNPTEEGYQIEWEDGSTDFIRENLTAGNYEATVTSASGTTRNGQTILPDPIFFNNVIIVNETCLGSADGSIDVQPEGGTTANFIYNLSLFNESGSSIIENVQNELFFVGGLNSGRYFLFISDDNNCEIIDTITIENNKSFSIAETLIEPTCNGQNNGSITVLAETVGNPPAGVWTFEWTSVPPLTSAPVNIQNESSITNLPAGEYTLRITDSDPAGCEAIFNFTLTEPPLLTITSSLEDVSSIGGNNGSIDLTIDGGISPYTFNWSNGATEEDLNNLSAGEYTVTVADANDCIAVNTFTISEPNTANDCRQRDSLALVALWNATHENGPWTNEWDLELPMDTWSGVTLSADECNVRLLFLNNRNLSGVIPSELKMLTAIEQIHLENNQLSGSIPSELGSLSSLTSLKLTSNLLVGSIPKEIGFISNLSILDLGDNKLSGSIPAELGQLSNLTLLWIYGNELTGSIPVQIGDLSNLRRLSINSNQLSGAIPPELGQLDRLTWFYASGNNFFGTIPIELTNMTAITRLFISNNNLEGCYPTQILELCSVGIDNPIDGIRFSGNPLLPWQGDFSRFCAGEEQIGAPCDDGDASTENDVITEECGCAGTLTCRASDSLQLVQLYEATHENGDWITEWDLNQPIDTWFGVTLNADGCVTQLNLSGTAQAGNNLVGQLPDLQLERVRLLSLVGNNLSGTIPDFSGMPILQRLRLTGNNFSGEIPNFQNLTQLIELNLDFNQLTGEIPDFSQFPNLIEIDLKSNQLTGEITDFSTLPTLRELYLYDNQLSGAIPPFTNCPDMRNLVVYANELDSMPDLSTLTNLIELQIDTNRLTFDDILPTLASNDLNLSVFSYAGMDSVFQNTTISTVAGTDFRMSLDFDEGVSTNTYQWFQDGTLVATVVGDNDLVIDNIPASATGNYQVVVTNSIATELTLVSRVFRIEVCEPAVNQIEDSICPVESITVNGTVYDSDNPVGTETLLGAAADGCDSLIEVNLTILESATSQIDTTICADETITIGETTLSTTDSYQITLNNAATNGCDSIVELNLTVADEVTFGAAAVEETLIACDADVALSANQPSGTQGEWMNEQGLNILDTNDPNTFITDAVAGIYELIWSLTVDDCPVYSSDVLSLSVENALVEQMDTFMLFNDTDFQAELEEVMLNERSFTLINAPTMGDLTLATDGAFDYTPVIDFCGLVSFSYEACNINCPELCTTNEVILDIRLRTDDEVTAPNVITPNGDKQNQTLIIPLLYNQPNLISQSKLSIFNQYGTIVYQAAPYENDWAGNNKNGEPLPQATYYYVLEMGDEIELTGKVIILK